MTQFLNDQFFVMKKYAVHVETDEGFILKYHSYVNCDGKTLYKSESFDFAADAYWNAVDWIYINNTVISSATFEGRRPYKDENDV